MKPSADTLSCEIVSGATGTFTLTVMVVGSDLSNTIDFAVTEKEYKVNWYVNGSKITQSYAYVQEIIVPEIAILKGYDFVRWSRDMPKTMPGYDIDILAVLNKKLGKVHSVSIDDILMKYKDLAMIVPNIAVDEGVSYTVTYLSSDPSVVTVDENGNITTRDKGSATITVTVTDEHGNTVTDTFEVTVKYKWWQWIIVIVLFGWIWY